MCEGPEARESGNTIGVSRTSVWWECEYEGVVTRESQSRGQIVRGRLGHGEEFGFYLKAME